MTAPAALPTTPGQGGAPPRTVLFAWRRIPPPFLIGGAEVSQQLLAEEFAAAGWNTHYLASHEPPWRESGSDLPEMLQQLETSGIAVNQPHPGDLRYTHHGVHVRAVPAAEIVPALHQALDTLRPDLVITSQEGSAELAALARERTTVLGWLHSVSATGMHVLEGRPQAALAVSRFVLERAPAGLPTVLLHPPFARPSAQARAGRPGDLLMINPVPQKGSALLHRLIPALPERHFTLVMGWWDTVDDFRSYPNVSYLRRTFNMSPLYDSHRLLLVPSLVEDAFPRVIVEAALHGLPTLGSSRGGIPEALGDHARCLPPDDEQPWVDAIRALDDHQLGRLGQQDQQRAQQWLRPLLPELAGHGLLP
ncbi:glycosyltransferase [Streptomyces sp. NPDC048255]|uniref:glycosyltransferase n=1 Tax=Streptomyces sp. NPDC048255 TaxID=3154713 RepID=UPI0033ED6C17